MNTWTYGCALITGASSGLGSEFARQAAVLGSDVILVARRRNKLEEVAREIEKLGRRAEIVVADLEQAADRARLGALMAERSIDLLVNNAGFGKIGPFVDSSLEESAGQVELNVRALMELSHHALQVFKGKSSPTALLNVASIASFSPLPHFAVYAATKAFVRDFTQSIAWEMQKTPTRVCVLCPGPTATEFFDRAGSSLLTAKMMSAREVVEAAYAGLREGRTEVVPGTLNRIAGLVAKVTPRNAAIAAGGELMRRRGS